jgi:hypothetical protein
MQLPSAASGAASLRRSDAFSSAWVQLPPMSQPLSPTHSVLFMQVELALQPLMPWQLLSAVHTPLPRPFALPG